MDFSYAVIRLNGPLDLKIAYIHNSQMYSILLLLNFFLIHDTRRKQSCKIFYTILHYTILFDCFWPNQYSKDM